MRLPVIEGIIDRRILVNYRVAADAMAAVLPAPFTPKLIHGYAIGGICLIRLKDVRPKAIPSPIGIQSENAAHRIAVEWQEQGQTREGVFVPRRDTSSRLNAFAGGRLFPGQQHHAKFDVDESADRLRVRVTSDDGGMTLSVDASLADALPDSSIFADMQQVSDFFERGSVGYSATRDGSRFDGMELQCHNWYVQPLNVSAVASSFFDDPQRFPADSVTFDNALLMRGIQHEWHARPDLHATK